MFVSVVVCTRNRADQLGEFLQSAAGLTVPPGLAWELIIVDNGSSDHTAEVVESFASQIPVRCVREDKAGLSNARNRGVDEAKGDYICWTDDDVKLDPKWLSAYVAAFGWTGQGVPSLDTMWTADREALATPLRLSRFLRLVSCVKTVVSAAITVCSALAT